MMEREDVVALSRVILRDALSHPPEDPSSFLVRVTSGTSGTQPLVIITEYSSEAPASAVAGGMKRIISCSGSMGVRLANALIVRKTAEGAVVQVLPLDPRDLLSGLDDLLKDFRPQVIYGLCSYVMKMSTFVRPSVAHCIRRLTFVGEILLPEVERHLADRFPDAEQDEQYMASETGGYIANRLCGHLPRNHYHPALGVTIRILDADEEGVGDILISKRIFRTVRLEDYRVGDIGRFVPGVCPCGEPVTFELLGRKGIDYVKLVGALLRRQEFDRVLAAFPGLIRDYRVEARQSTKRGVMQGLVTLRIHYPGGTFSADLVREIREKIERNLFVTPSKTFADLVSQGVFKPLIVEFSDGPFTQGHKDVKLKLLASTA